LAKVRTPIPEDVAAEVLFLHNHTCAICNVPGLGVQIHHIDEDPSNNVLENLTVLCLQCHDDTQTRGGFGRHLKADEVRRYRSDWLARVAARRARADELAVSRIAGVKIPAPATESWTPPPITMLTPYVNSLPRALQLSYAAAREGWDSGVTLSMMGATLDVTEVLERIWLYLARWYPPTHFGDSSAEQYINDFLADRREFHRALAEPDGPGTGGTIVSLLVGGATLRDLEALVADTVAALTTGTTFSFRSWSWRWYVARSRTLQWLRV